MLDDGLAEPAFFAEGLYDLGLIAAAVAFLSNERGPRLAYSTSWPKKKVAWWHNENRIVKFGAEIPCIFGRGHSQTAKFEGAESELEKSEYRLAAVKAEC